MDFVEQLKTSVDIVEVVGQYVRLQKAGLRHKGLCPFHNEKTPSFSVHPAHQFYKCFGCGAGGDVISFVMEIEGLTFYEALKLLADRHGIAMPKRAEYSDAETKKRAAVFHMHEIAAALFRTALESRSGADARGYLARRGVPAALAEEFGLGYAEPSGQMLARALQKEGFAAELLEQSGLLLSRQDGSGHFDLFRGRLMFPIHNEGGKVIAFGGRALSEGQEPKYLNSPETPIYRKSYVLYNLHRAKDALRKAGRAVLVEGYMDAIGVWAGGVKEVVASCGTALVSQQVRAMKRHADAIVVNFDPDAAGVRAAERTIQMLLDEGMRVRVLELEGELDPDDYVRRHGGAVYRERLDKAPGYFNWLADRARARYDMSTHEGRVAGLQFLLPSIQRLSDKLERAGVAEEVASYLKIEAGLVLETFRKAAAGRHQAKLPAKSPVRPLESILLHAALLHEEVRRDVLPRLRNAPELQRFATRRVFQALFAMCDGGSAFSFAELYSRLEDSDRELLSGIALADEKQQEACSPEEARRCLQVLEQMDREARRTDLKAQIKEAERAGMLEDAFRKTKELGRLDST